MIRNVIATCPACSNASKTLLPQPKAFGLVARFVNEWCVMDTTHVFLLPTASGSRKQMACLHLLDVASRWSLFIPLTEKRDVTARDVIYAFNWWNLMFGRVPFNLMCDQGKPFVSQEFTDYFSCNGGTNFWCPAYNSPSAGIVERHHLTIQTIWNRLLEDEAIISSIKSKSLSYLSLGLTVSLAKNSMIRRTGGLSAQQIAFGHSVDPQNNAIEGGPAEFNSESHRDLRRKAIEIANSADLGKKLQFEMLKQRRIPGPLWPGQHVDFRIRNPQRNRAGEYWLHNCLVVARTGTDRYVIKLPRSKFQEVHRRTLRLSVEDEPVIAIPFDPNDSAESREQKVRSSTEKLGLKYDIEPATHEVIPDEIVEDEKSDDDLQSEPHVQQEVSNDEPFTQMGNPEPVEEISPPIDNDTIPKNDKPQSSAKTSLKPANKIHVPPGLNIDPPTQLRRSARIRARQQVFVWCSNFAGHVNIDPDTGQIDHKDYIYLVSQMGGIVDLTKDAAYAMKKSNVRKWIRQKKKASNPLMQGKSKATRPLTREEEQTWADQIKIAKQIELKAFDKLATFDSKPYNKVEHASAITFKWVFTIKPVDPKQLTSLQSDPIKSKILVNDGTSRIKARLVVRGFQEDVNLDTASPTCRRQSLACVLSWATINNFEVLSGDTPNAFLRGRELSRPVFVFPPEEHIDFERGHIWVLTRCVYGLIDAPLRWYEAARDMVQQCGGLYDSLDPAVARFANPSNPKQICGVVPWHVDDFIFVGDKLFYDKIFPKLRDTLSFPECENPRDKGGMRFTGAYIIRDDNGIWVSQDIYCNNLSEIDCSSIKDLKSDTVVPEIFQAAFRSLTASCAWATQRCALTEMFVVSLMSTKAGKCTVEDIRTINKCVRRLKHHSQRILFPKFNCNFENCRILVVCDSSHGVRAQGCYFVLITNNQCSTDNGPQPAHVISAKSWRLKRVAVSTFSAEAQALVEGSNAGKLIQELILRFMHIRLEIDLRTDHKGLVDHCNSMCAGLSCVRTELQVKLIKENLGEGRDFRSLKHVAGDDNIADIGTVFPSRVCDAVRTLMNQGLIQNLY